MKVEDAVVHVTGSLAELFDRIVQQDLERSVHRRRGVGRFVVYHAFALIHVDVIVVILRLYRLRSSLRLENI